MKKSDKPAEKLDLLDLDLDLPDWSGMVENSSRMSAQAASDLCEQVLEMVSGGIAASARRLA